MLGAPGLRRLLWVGVSVVALSWSAPRPLRAADPGEVEALIRKGVQLRRAGENHRALPLLQKAHELAHTARTAAQLGLVEMALGYPLDAERHLSESLAATHDLWVQNNRKVLEDALVHVRAVIGEIALAGSPPGAEVRLNGNVVGKLPLPGPLRVAEGPAELELRASGRSPLSRTVVVSGGKRSEVAMNLEREPAAAPVASATEPVAVARPLLAPAGGREGDKEQASDPETAPSEQGDKSSIARPAAWVMTVAAAAAAGLAAFETATWLKRKGDFDGHAVPSRENRAILVNDCGAADLNRGGPECDTIYRAMDKAKNLMIVGYAMAGAFAASAAVLFVVSSRPADAFPTQALACAPAASPPGIVCHLSF